MAARNCLVEVEGMKIGTLKVTDFGLTRHLEGKEAYKVKFQEKLPVKWSALESLDSFIWTQASDVWSLAVLFWEVVIFGTFLQD